MSDSSSDDSDIGDVLEPTTDAVSLALPYQFEPDASSSEVDSSSEDEVMENDRMANSDW